MFGFFFFWGGGIFLKKKMKRREVKKVGTSKLHCSLKQKREAFYTLEVVQYKVISPYTETCSCSYFKVLKLYECSTQ